VFVNKLRKPQRASHSGWSTANNNNIGWHLWASYIVRGFAENEHKNTPQIFTDSNGSESNF
jgi:hypothetical protein